MIMNTVECPIFIPIPGDRIRIIVRYKNTWRPIFWFKLSKDGSVYLGPRLTEILELRSGKANPIEDNQFRVQYSEGGRIDNPELLMQAKLSFHGSGIVNMPGGRTSGEKIRSLNEQALLCVTTFRHLSHFDVVDEAEIKSRDVCLNCPIDEARPLWGQLWIASSTKESPVLHDSDAVKWQINIVFRYQGIEEIEGLTLQLVLAYGLEGPWPPYNYVLFAGWDAQ
jgi:hypothetical protein